MVIGQSYSPVFLLFIFCLKISITMLAVYKGYMYNSVLVNCTLYLQKYLFFLFNNFGLGFHLDANILTSFLLFAHAWHLLAHFFIFSFFSHCHLVSAVFLTNSLKLDFFFLTDLRVFVI